MTALLITGDQGTGKSIVFDELIGKMLGERQYGKSSSREHIVGKFNSVLACKTLWVSEESLFAGDRVSMQILKDRITSQTIPIERKGLEIVQCPSYTRFVFNSNMMHALHLEENDRRFVVYRASNKYRQNIAYFEALSKWCEKDGKRFFLQYLLDFKPEDVGLDWACLKTAPQTAAKRDQIEMSVENADSFFIDILKNGRITASDHFMEGQNVSWSLTEESAINPKTLQTCYNMFLQRTGGMNGRYDRAKYLALAKKYLTGGVSFSEFEHTGWAEGRSVRVLKLPPRELAIQAAVKDGYLTVADLTSARKFPNSHKADTLEVI
jgi:hypothetical protein